MVKKKNNVEQLNEFKYEIVKGFLNLKISDAYLISRLFYVQNFCNELERRLKENIYTPKKDES